VVSWSSSGSKDGRSAAPAGIAANASSTNPASRCEKTASPSATRRIASASSSVLIVFVTYPRAPARITAITSSGASDADSARNRTDGCAPLTASITAWPPPPGRCTSSSTTSGTAEVIVSTADATSSASPATDTRAPYSGRPSSARTPDRNRPWSSTSTTLTGALLIRSGLILALLMLALARRRRAASSG
jgi:hypothetical protein